MFKRISSVAGLCCLAFVPCAFSQVPGLRNPVTLKDWLAPRRERAANEECSGDITGQFYIRICTEVEKTETVPEDYLIDKTCVVYDEEKCCNVMVTQRVKQTRYVQRIVKRPAEKVFCKQMTVTLDELESLPDCSCDIHGFVPDKSQEDGNTPKTGMSFSTPTEELELYLTPRRELAADEQCSGGITGQFYFRICADIEKSAIVPEEYFIEKTCIVYDEEKCCNIAVTQKVLATRYVERIVKRKVEKAFCKRKTVTLDEIKALPDCPCDIHDFLPDESQEAGDTPNTGTSFSRPTPDTHLASGKSEDVVNSTVGWAEEILRRVIPAIRAATGIVGSHNIPWVRPGSRRQPSR